VALILSARFDDALALAHRLHRHQGRKGSDVPYVAHLLAVTAIVLEHGGDEDEAIAALLHDAVEDQGGPATLATIRAAFGDRVATIVEDCSDTDETPKPPWRVRKEVYLAHLEHADASALLVSCADKLHNARCTLRDLRTVGNTVWTKFRGGGREGTLWYWRAALDLFARRGPVALATELEEVVREIEGLVAAAALSDRGAGPADRR
jgi:GTP pyrophosphokinase